MLAAFHALLLACAADSMRFEIVVPDSVPLGAPVPIVLRLTNPGPEPITVYLQGRPIAFDITVTDAQGRMVWRRLEGKVVTAILAIRRLEPGAHLEVEDIWRQVAGSGAPVPPGEYQVAGSLPTDAEPLRTAPARLRIVR